MATYTGLCVCGRQLEVARHPEGGVFMNCFDCFPQFEKAKGNDADKLKEKMEEQIYESEER